MAHPVIKGAEPFASPGGPGGVLVLHGFTGNPQSMRPLAEALAAAGFAVDLPLLPGHGTDMSELLDKRWSDWCATAEQALTDLEKRCESVVVVGLSMGGTLTCWLAELRRSNAGEDCTLITTATCTSRHMRTSTSGDPHRAPWCSAAAFSISRLFVAST